MQTSEKTITRFTRIDKKDALLLRILMRKCKKRKQVKKSIMLYMKDCEKRCTFTEKPDAKMYF